MAAESKLGLCHAFVLGAQGGGFGIECFGFSVLGIDLDGVGFDVGESTGLVSCPAPSLLYDVPG